jgi:Uma2 family endonuclease
VSESAKRLATYEDLLGLPEHVRAEIVAGEVVVSPSPSPLHQSVVGEIYAELRGPFQRNRGGPGGWWLVPDVDVLFGPNDIYRPDISGWRKENLPAFPLERPVPHRPDWICEGLSPRTAVIDQGAKRTTYALAGVPWYWLVEPSNRTISVLRLTDEGYVVDMVVGDRGRARLAPFEAIEIELDSLFPPSQISE